MGIRCGGGNYNLFGDCRLGNIRTPHNRIDAPPCRLAIGNQTDSIKKWKISATATAMETCRTAPMSLESVEGRGGRRSNKEPVACEKVDRWMRESVEAIVKNLWKAPLLVQLYGKNEDDEIGGVETKKAVDHDDWAVAKNRWNSGEAPLPDGVIFVEELSEKDDEEEIGQNDVVDGITKAWGIVVQGKGLECGPACYLLKTTSVGVRSGGSGPGFGCGCTHFCLVKVNSFWETAESQLNNCWARTYEQEQSEGRTWTGLLFF